MKPILLDSLSARKALGNIGKTKFFQMCRNGELVRVKIGRKSAVTYESVVARAQSGD